MSVATLCMKFSKHIIVIGCLPGLLTGHTQQNAPEFIPVVDFSSSFMYRTDSNDSFDSSYSAPTLENVDKKYEYHKSDQSSALASHQTSYTDTELCFDLDLDEVTTQNIWLNNAADDMNGARPHFENRQNMADHIRYNDKTSSQEAGLHFDDVRYWSDNANLNMGLPFATTESHPENGQFHAGTGVHQAPINTYTFGNPSTGELHIITCPDDVIVESWSSGSSVFTFKNKHPCAAHEDHSAF